jgi:PST family polysaccharide transporter
MSKAARTTAISFYIVAGASVFLTLAMWFGASLIIPIILGHGFAPSEGVLQILGLRAPLIAWVNVLGFQWLLVLGLERQFQRVTVAALVLNVFLAVVLAPRFSYDGMAWAVVTSQFAAAAGIYIVLQRRGLNPFSMRTRESYA